MANKDLTTIVFNTEGLEKETGWTDVGKCCAINYMKLGDYGDGKDNYFRSVFNIGRKYVQSVSEREGRVDVVLREGVDVKLDSFPDGTYTGMVEIVTDEVDSIRVPMFGLGRFFDKSRWAADKGAKVFVPIPGTRRKEYCAELPYVDCVTKGDKVVYQREVGQ